MADVGGSPFSVKKENSQSVVLTYFQGDIGSMVDAHFTRALGRADRAKAIKPKKSFKFLKTEDQSTCQWMSPSPSSSYPEAQFLSRKESQGGLPFCPVDELPSGWPPFPVRHQQQQQQQQQQQGAGVGAGAGGEAAGPALPLVQYPLGADGLAGQQYATSLLNLLHSDRSEMLLAPGLASGSKPELLLPSWSAPAAFRDGLDTGADFDPGRSVDKKVLYWY